MHDRLPPNGCDQAYVVSFILGEISAISETVQNRHTVAIED